MPPGRDFAAPHRVARRATKLTQMKTKKSLKPQTKVTLVLAVVIAVAIGAAGGLGVFTFVYAKGGSYLGNDPNACANCHIMKDHLDAWVKSSHHAVATCNDCHTPSGMIPKYLTKAEHGFFHSLAFTTDNFHEPIQIKERSRRVTEGACRKCHRDIVHDIDLSTKSQDAVSCIRCHASVGHAT
jgi:cytochrome c nitrite reductase small subunit